MTEFVEVSQPAKRTYRKSNKKKCTVCGEKFSPQGMTAHMRKHEREEAALQHAADITPAPPTEFLAAVAPSDFSVVINVTSGQISRVSINKLV